MRQAWTVRRLGPLALLGVLGVAVPLIWRAGGPRLQVVNRSGAAVEGLEVIVCGQTVRFGALVSGGQAEARYTVTADGHFTVQGRLADGTPLQGDLGYVTPGLRGSDARIIVGPAGRLALEQGG